jgi:hypothetical protein
MTLTAQCKDGMARGGRALAITTLTLLAAACASAGFDAPANHDDTVLRAGAVTATQDGIQVSATVPGVEQARAIYGVNLDAKGIQPLWVEVDNGSDRAFVMMPTSLDPEYFAPLEAAFLYKGGLSDEGYAALAAHFQRLSFDHRSAILPGETVNGFVLINRVDPTMIAEVDLIGENWSQRIDLVVPIPGTETPRQAVDALGRRYGESDIREIDDEAELRSALEGLPCCTTDKIGSKANLPLNLVLIGDITDYGPAFLRRGYRYRTVDPDFALGRPQDLSASQTSRWVAPQAHIVRVWLTPLRYRNKPVWVGQISTPRGGRFADPAKTQPVIDPHTDDARNDVVQDLIYSQSLAKIGFVSLTAPRVPEGALPYRTDGLRAVLLFTAEPVSLDEINFFEWERPADYQRQTKAR